MMRREAVGFDDSSSKAATFTNSGRTRTGPMTYRAWLCCVFLVVGCGGTGSSGPEDAAKPADSSGSDGVQDGGVDAPTDSAIDGPTDAMVDAMTDAAIDAPIDAAIDAPIDAAIDAPIDAPVDAMVDAAIDAPMIDAPIDAPSCTS
ncbi:MAG: hypothetical protein JNL83_39700, partial [Myxococcales bacterium]|nr:hypothetical protein [Myxococcales bacterium]